MEDRLYIYSDDSQLLGEMIEKLGNGDNYLEIGVGGGKNLLIAAQKFKLVVGTDIRRDISETTSEIPSVAELIVSDRASCFRESIFDVVAFNPPYIPTERIEDLATDGGQNGVEAPLRFLESSLSVLKPNGSILMLLSSDDSMSTFQKFCSDHKLDARKIGAKNLFFETISAYLIKRRFD